MRDVRRSWSRTAKKVVTAAYVVGVPESRIRMHAMGNPKMVDKADLTLSLATSQPVQIRDNAMEAARVSANKVFEKAILPEDYFLQVRVYPHQCLREHIMMSGAGADRLSDGMRLAFGRPAGRAVIAKKGQKLMTVYTLKKYEENARRGLKIAAGKLPGKCRIA